MDKLDRLKVKKVMERLAKKYNMSTEEIEKIVNSPYHFTYEKLKDLDLDNVESEDEVNSLKTNFNYKGLGKLYVNFRSLLARKQRKNNLIKMNEEQWKK